MNTPIFQKGHLRVTKMRRECEGCGNVTMCKVLTGKDCVSIAWCGQCHGDMGQAFIQQITNPLAKNALQEAVKTYVSTRKAGHLYSPREGTDICGICGFHKNEHAPEHFQ